MNSAFLFAWKSLYFSSNRKDRFWIQHYKLVRIFFFPFNTVNPSLHYFCLPYFWWKFHCDSYSSICKVVFPFTSFKIFSLTFVSWNLKMICLSVCVHMCASLSLNAGKRTFWITDAALTLTKEKSLQASQASKDWEKYYILVYWNPREVYLSVQATVQSNHP